MTTGEGIFYGLVFLGLIWLYSVTRDRWNWKRIAKWAVGVFVLPLIGLGLWLGVSNYLESRPQVATVFWGLSPGITKDELFFRKGKPDEESEGFVAYRKTGDKVAYLVTMKNEKVRAVRAIVVEGGEYNLPSIQGISSHSTQADVERKFGLPDHVSESKDKTRRMLSYLKFGLVFSFEKGVVVLVGVLDPKEGSMEFGEHQAK